jgi:hypothetical protein
MPGPPDEAPAAALEAIIAGLPTSFPDAREQAVYEAAMALAGGRLVHSPQNFDLPCYRVTTTFTPPACCRRPDAKPQKPAETDRSPSNLSWDRPGMLDAGLGLIDPHPIDEGGRLMDQSIRDVMTPNPSTISRSASLLDAAQLMRGNDIGDVIVLENDRSSAS